MAESSGRIALYHPALGFGGVERVMLNLARGLVERGLPVDLVPANAQGEFRDQVPKGVRLVDLGSRRVIQSLPPLVRYLRREHPAVLLSAADHANTLAVWARKLARVPTRIVISQHTALSYTSRFALGLRGQIAVVAARWTYPYADDFVAVSTGVAEDLARVLKIAPERIHVIPNPVVTPELVQKAQALVEHPWVQPGAPPVITSAGRLWKQKDFPTLIRAFSMVRREIPARLMILGEGPERPQLEQLVRELGLEAEVVLPGYVDNPTAYMRRSAVFALSSAWEGSSIVLVEALVAGVPIVSTDCESGPREVLDGGRYGALVPVGDVRALADAILLKLKEGKRPFPLEALRRFELGAVTEAYLRVLSPGAGPPAATRIA